MPWDGRPQRRSQDLTPQDRQLMAEHDNLQLFGVSRSEQKRDKLQDPSKGNARDGQQHGLFPYAKAAMLGKIDLTHPTHNC
jgi:hypothetical protein